MNLFICNKKEICQAEYCYHREQHNKPDDESCLREEKCQANMMVMCVPVNSKAINVIKDGKVIHEYKEER